VLKQLAAVTGLTISQIDRLLQSLKLRQQFPFFSDVQETVTMSCMIYEMKAKDMP